RCGARQTRGGGGQRGCSRRIGDGGRVLAVDLKFLDPVRGALILTKDVLEENSISEIRTILEGPADVVLSDMAAPSTGHRKTDALRVMTLCEGALDVAKTVLSPGGCFVVKVLKVGAEINLVKSLKKEFLSVRHAKPPASRSDSSESYVVATDFRG
ncbi:MAG TPA: RlmE family RNA methyltransferase, partial [Alphaproteobacteria bacterium]|nr:RlmE family RNA methyltransferase [Alphaproteobacteria bacterium]